LAIETPTPAESVQLEGLGRHVGRGLAGELGQKVALLAELVAQRRQGGLALREGCLLGGDVGHRTLADAESALQQGKGLTLDLDGALGGGDLAAQRGLGDGGDHDVGGEGEIGRLELEALLLGLGVERFGGTPRAAPQVGDESDVQQAGEQSVDRSAGGCGGRERGRRLVLAAAQRGADGGEQRGALGLRVLLRELQGLDRGLDVGIGRERARDQVAERAGLEDAPPLRRDVETLHEGLRLAAQHVGRGDRLIGRLA